MLAGRQESQGSFRANTLLVQISFGVGSGQNKTEVSVRMTVHGQEEPLGIDALRQRETRNVAPAHDLPIGIRYRANWKSFKYGTRGIHLLLHAHSLKGLDEALRKKLDVRSDESRIDLHIQIHPFVTE